MLSDKQWSDLEPLMEVCRPHAKVPSPHLRRTVEAILWRHQNGAQWRALPTEFGPWWMAAQTFISWARLGVWERLLVSTCRLTPPLRTKECGHTGTVLLDEGRA